MTRYRKPPVILTFLAPADRCNQRCPRCLIDLVGEPVTSFDLSPTDYASTVAQLAEAGVPVLSISFQGHEVTLPKSWPYVEAVFAEAERYGIPTGFVTNGMLLHKWTRRIQMLDPERITVSLDGPDAATNDPIRGLPGAFEATVSSVRRFLAEAPEMRDSLAIASTVHLAKNSKALLRMPTVLSNLGVTRWVLGVELEVRGGRKRMVDDSSALERALGLLLDAGKGAGLKVHVSDEFGRLPERDRHSSMDYRTLYSSDFLIRVEPAGYVLVGDEIRTAFDRSQARRFHPKRDHFVDVIGYEARAANFTRAWQTARRGAAAGRA